jgi:hypothetical protein
VVNGSHCGWTRGSSRDRDASGTSCPSARPAGWGPIGMTGNGRARPPRSCCRKPSERVTGIEPAPPAWKAGALPLSYTRVARRSVGPALSLQVDYFRVAGVWRSLVAHSLWERGAVGSNPATPTSQMPWPAETRSGHRRFWLTSSPAPRKPLAFVEVFPVQVGFA